MMPRQSRQIQDQTPRTFGQRLAKARIEAGGSQAALAHAVGATQAQICRWEKDLAEPNFGHVAKIVEVLGRFDSVITVQYLVTGETAPAPQPEQPQPEQPSPRSSDVQQINPWVFKGFAVRIIEGPDGQPWWVAKDVCDVLDHSDVSMAVRRLDADEKGTSSVCTPSGDQNMLIINESGLYSLIMTSRKPEAKAFRKWVTSVVLPTIRKTGKYEAPAASTRPPVDDAQDPIMAILGVIGATREAQLEQGARIESLEAVVEELQKKLPIVRRTAPEGHYRLSDWAFDKGYKISIGQEGNEGKKATALAEEMDVPLVTIRLPNKHPYHVYPVPVLEAWLVGYLKRRPEPPMSLFRAPDAS